MARSRLRENQVIDVDFLSEAEMTTISGSLQANIDAKPDTLLDLIDTSAFYDDGKYLRSTTSGAEWTSEFVATVSGADHATLDNLDYASAGHTGFASSASVKKHFTIRPEAVKLGSPGPAQAVIGNFSVLQFTGVTTTQSVYTSFHIPTDWEVGTDINTRIYWAPVNTSSGTVVWQMTYDAVASEANEVISNAGTTTYIADDAQNVQDELLESGDMTISGTNLALEDTIGMTFFRDPTHGSDNYESPASLVEIEIEYTSDKLGEVV